MKTALPTVGALLLALGSAYAEPVGRYLILDNEQLIEGEVRRDGNRFVVKRGEGEASIPASRVAEVAASRADVYRLMRERCNLRDLDERLRLIRWLMGNNFRAEALTEAEELARFRPDDRQVKIMLDGLRAIDKTPANVAKSAVPRVLDQAVDIAPPRYNPESYPLFVAKVQPILQNLCIRCHSEGQGGGFQLTRVADGSDRRAAALNMASALKFLDRRNPENSPLLEKAVTAHGTAVRPVLRDRESPAFKVLEAWASQAVAGVEAAPEPPPVLLPTRIVEQPKANRPPPVTSFGETSTSQARPEPQTEPKDPFDPAIFNGTIQPKK